MTDEQRKKKREKERERYAWYKSHGICVKCKKEDAEPPYTMCLVCRGDEAERNRAYNMTHLKQQSEYNRARREKKKKEGICVICGREPASGGRTFCEEGRKKKNLEQRRQYQPVVKPYGECKYCTQQAVAGFAFCPEHLEQARKRAEHARTRRSESPRIREIKAYWDVWWANRMRRKKEEKRNDAE